jgi:hypothetical protein
MAHITITTVLEDSPPGGVSIHCTYTPALGQKTTRAMTAAQEIVNRTCREYGLPNPWVAPSSESTSSGVDIDAVHHTRDRVVQTEGIRYSSDARQ